MKRFVKSLNTFINENAAATPTNVDPVRGLVFYKQANTQAGATTPTGQSNAFDNNMFGMTEEQVYKVAADFKFRTDNNVNFQTDLYAHLQAKHPDVLQAMWNKYGMTNAGKFADGMLGGRTMFAISVFSKKNQDAPAQAFNGERMFGPNNHIVGLARVQTRQTNTQAVAGNTNTNPGNYPKVVEFMYVLKDTTTPDQSKGLYVIPFDVWTNQIARGTNRITDLSQLEQYKVQANTQQASTNITNANNGTATPAVGQ